MCVHYGVTQCYGPWNAWNVAVNLLHYSDVIMSAVASQITSLTIVCSTVYSCADQKKHQSSASLAFVRGIHQWPLNSPQKGTATRKMFPFDYVIMGIWNILIANRMIMTKETFFNNSPPLSLYTLAMLSYTSGQWQRVQHDRKLEIWSCISGNN